MIAWFCLLYLILLLGAAGAAVVWVFANLAIYPSLFPLSLSGSSPCHDFESQEGCCSPRLHVCGQESGKTRGRVSDSRRGRPPS